MNAKDIIGKRVARVEQSWFEGTSGGKHYCIDRIVFTDGTVLYFNVIEGEGDYGVQAHIVKKEGTNVRT